MLWGLDNKNKMKTNPFTKSEYLIPIACFSSVLFDKSSHNLHCNFVSGLQMYGHASPHVCFTYVSHMLQGLYFRGKFVFKFHFPLVDTVCGQRHTDRGANEEIIWSAARSICIGEKFGRWWWDRSLFFLGFSRDEDRAPPWELLRIEVLLGLEYIVVLVFGGSFDFKRVSLCCQMNKEVRAGFERSISE